MKNYIVWSTLATLLYTQAHADTTPSAITAPNTTAESQPTVSAPPISTTATPAATPTATPTATPAATPTTTPAPTGAQPAASLPAQTVTPPTTNVPAATNEAAPAEATPNTPPINCDYRIDAKVKTIDPALVQNWSEKATIQAFTFDPVNINGLMGQLQHCFTEQGWKGFNAALTKSGNLEAIQTHQLNVSSLIDGPIQLNDVKDNQWKLTLPVQVVYQNDKEKVTQLLTVQLTVGRKMTGDLGITQMIATPRAQESTPTDPASPPKTATTPSNSNPNTP
ncbi:MAG: type IV secretion protein IcmL [Legionella sp.]|nr:MAG: type IV secretion protein IcmL [Legionella sp.]PJD99868.1 MAG: type IV secretion protein IcmL [Legionella sp.]